MAGSAMDLRDSLVEEGCPYKELGAPGSEADCSDLPINNQDWIEGCYHKLHAVSRALDIHLMEASHETMETEEGAYEYHHEHPVSRPESVIEGDSVSSPPGPDGLNFMDFGKFDGCHPDFDFQGEPTPPFDVKSKRFSKYLQDLRNQGTLDPFEEAEPSDFPLPDALSIMDARLEAKRSNIGDKGECSNDESFPEQVELDMDTSLQEYLESDNDITSHPLYKRLCAAHISLCKVNHLYSRICAAHIALSKLGATDAQLKEMEELSHEIENKLPAAVEASSSSPELDKFMNEYCDFLEMHKEEFSKPFEEAMEFCKQIDEELATSGLRFLRDNCPTGQTLTNETIARLQELPLEGEA